ncbi:hypothetical protein L1887_32668 [Cichorium endivia]|nr:hypothetical protein L1887_32668 [Cichorium endivia]
MVWQFRSLSPTTPIRLPEIVDSTAITFPVKFLLLKLEIHDERIKALLKDASQKEISDEAIKGCLNDLQHLAYDIDDLLDVLQTKAIRRELD